MLRILTLTLFISLLPVTFSITCYQCASADGNSCPTVAKSFTSDSHNACITWRLGNGTILLQNLVTAEDECTDEKISFWSQFVDLYYKTVGGSVSCCYSDLCNDGSSAVGLYPTKNFPLPVSNNPLSSSYPAAAGVNDDTNLNRVPDFLSHREGNCEKYYEKINSDEWVPDILVPLAYDRASESKVGVFYTKLGERSGNNDHVVVRILNKNKQNLTMYSVKLFRVGTVSIHINKLEAQRNGGEFIQQDGRKVSVNNVINLDKDRFQGFWISIRNNVEISIGQIGDKLVDSVANFTDVLREGPADPYYFGLTTPSSTAASFGVNCDMPGLHFDDTCVSDEDCVDFPQTVCRAMPVNKGLDPGTRAVPFEEWKTGDEILKSCWCKEGHMRIPESKGCYDPIRKVITLRDACFADYHCNDLPNTACSDDLFMDRYNKSCQCLPGNKPFEPNPRTGLVEGCAPLTKKDKATVSGCSRRFELKEKKEWVPETSFPVEFDDYYQADIAVFYVKLGSVFDVGNKDEDVAVIRLMNREKDRRKMYTVKIFREGGKIALYESRITRSFFFSNENDREVAVYADPQTLRRLEDDFVGFWIQYKYEEGYGGQLSLGLNGAPFSPDYAILRWTDTSTSALRGIKYLGFTNGDRQSSIEYGANCVLLKTQIPDLRNSYSQISPQLQTTFFTASNKGSLLTPNQGGNPWDFVATSPDLLNSHLIKSNQQQQTVIEPVLKSEYLTKLKRILPTYLDGLQNDEMAKAFDQVSQKINV